MIDSHCHIADAEFDADRDNVFARAAQSHVTHMIAIGASDAWESNERAVALAAQHPNVFASVGCHPTSAQEYSEAYLEKLRPLAAHPKVVAIGESGLDFHYGVEHRAQQERALRDQLALALEHQRALILHVRDAIPELLDILRAAPQLPRLIFHCFTSTADHAHAMLALDGYLSLPGVLTFKKSHALRALAATLPHDRILIETDSPYLAPEPYRGKRNEPAFVAHTLECLASCWKMPKEECDAITTRNTITAFGLAINLE